MKIAILGGGISGLAARYYLSKRCPEAEITLFEKGGRVGGCMHTEGGFERGPRTFKASRSGALLDLIGELGLEGEILYSDKGARRRYVWNGKKLQSLGSFIPKVIPSLLREWRAPAHVGDETVYNFVERRLGKWVAESLFDPLTLGIYAGDIRKLSVESCYPLLKKMEQEHGSLTKALLRKKRNKGGKGLFTLRGGVSHLVGALAKQGRGEIRLNTPLDSLPEGFDRTIIALPTPAAAQLFAFDDICGAFFSSIESVELTVVNLTYNAQVLKKGGFGYLIPTQFEERVLGMVFDSSIFPEQNRTPNETRLTAMVHASPSDAKTLALDALKRHLNIKHLPIGIETTHYPHAIPHYLPNHKARTDAFLTYLREKHPQITCIGNYLSGVSVSDCVELARGV